MAEGTAVAQWFACKRLAWVHSLKRYASSMTYKMPSQESNAFHFSFWEVNIVPEKINESTLKSKIYGKLMTGKLF